MRTNNNFCQESIAGTSQWNTQRNSRQWFIATVLLLHSSAWGVSDKPLCFSSLCILVVLHHLSCSAGELQAALMAGFPWVREFSTGTGEAKLYNTTAVGTLHRTPDGKSTIYLVQTAARLLNEKMAIYRVEEKSLQLVLLLAHEQWLLHQRKSPAPVSPADFNRTLPGWFQMTLLA